jgi:PAS domain S-box-containing protein
MANDPPRPPVPGSDELLRIVMESATDFAIFSTDLSGLVTGWNTGAERMLGFTEAEMIGHSADVIFTPEDRIAGAAEEERRIATAEGRAEDERWQIRKDGNRFWASGLMMRLSDPTFGYVKILRDRTEQHHTELRIRESEARFRLLATNIPQLVFRSRIDGRRSWGSPQWIDFTGLGFDESIEFGWLDAIHPEDREATMAAWAEAAESGEYYVEHRVCRAATGDYRWHQTRARPIQAGTDDPDVDWVGTMSDVHDLRELQGRQQILLAELQHRTRNLLAVTQAIASRTLRSSASLDAFGDEFGGRLRALSRVQGLSMHAEGGVIDLRDLVAGELAMHGDLGPKIDIDGGPVALNTTTAQTLGLALHELATNAAKYGALRQEPGRLDISWRPERDETGYHLALDWRESGVAMPTDAARQKGYGRELIERALPYQLGAKTRLEFAADGVRCRIIVPLRSADHG